MKQPQRTLGSTPNPLRQLWDLCVDAFQNFVWADLRLGMIRFSDISLQSRAAIWLGFGVTVAVLVLLTQAPTLRALFPLYTSVTPAPGRGLHVPLPLFPLSLILLVLAWSYLLSGARRSHWAIRWGVFLFFTLTLASWLVTLLAAAPWVVAIGGIFYGVLLLTYLWPQQHKLSHALLFTVTLSTVGGLFAVVQLQLVLQDQASGLPIGKTVLEGNLRSLATLVIPLLIFIGLDIADFTVQASSWIRSATTQLLPLWLCSVLTFTLLAWLLWQGVQYLAQQHASGGWLAALAPIGGTCALMLLLWLTWQLLSRFIKQPATISLDDFANAANQVAFPLVILFVLPLLVSFLTLEIAQILQSLGVQLQTGFYGNHAGFVAWAATFYTNAVEFESRIVLCLITWQRLWAAGAIMAAIFLLLRQPGGALYAATVGVNTLWVEVTRPGEWLQGLGWYSPEPLVLTWVLLVVAWALRLLWRRTFTRSNLNHLLLLTVMLALMRQTTLIASPLEPLFSLAGTGTLAVGLGWDMLSAGSWANESSASLPRLSRIFLYIGYVMLTVMLVNWAVAAHDMTLFDRFTGEAALTGLSLLGYPYLFAVFYLSLTERSQSVTP